MLFNSQIFICLYLPIVIAAYYTLGISHERRMALLVTASLLFYGSWNFGFLPLLIGLGVGNWIVGSAFVRTGHAAWIVAGIVGNLSLLAYFKLTNFVLLNLTWAFGPSLGPLDILVPLGISFFVFQKISYLADLWRGDRHAYRLVDFLAFVTFFPQLIAGPIVRHHEIIPQFAADPRTPDAWERGARGLTLFVLGLGKKIVLADGAGQVCDPLFGRLQAGPSLGFGEAWTAAGSYALQIYFDFSGYSDMAIGMALMFGLRLPMNFDAPYRATSIRMFWRRWHMTLSRFLRDYLYIPLGGNRVGRARRAGNLLATMLLAGLWHDAGWTFVAWGGLHGAALAADGAWHRSGRALPPGLGWGLTSSFVLVTWVVFRAPDLRSAVDVWGSMLGLHGWRGAAVPRWPVLAAGAAGALLGPTTQRIALDLLEPSLGLAAALGAAVALGLLQLGDRIPNAFIYFQF